MSIFLLSLVSCLLSSERDRSHTFETSSVLTLLFFIPFFFLRISAGELAIHNNRRIQDIYSVLSEAATRSELKDVAQTIINQHQTDVKCK